MINSYFAALDLAINECCKFVVFHDLGYKEKGIIATFTLPQILRCIKRLAEVIPNLSDYRIVGTKFKLEYLVETTIRIVEELRDMAISLQLELNLEITNNYNQFSDYKLHDVCQSVYKELSISIQQYELYMEKFKLNKLQKSTFDNLQKLIKEKSVIVPGTLSKSGKLCGVHKLHDNPIFKWIDSGNLDSTKRHPALLTSEHPKETFMQQLSQLDIDYT